MAKMQRVAEGRTRLRLFEGFEVPDSVGERILYQKMLDGYADLPFSDWMTFRFGDVEMVGGVKGSMQRVTKQSNLSMWMQNLADNVGIISRTNHMDLIALEKQAKTRRGRSRGWGVVIGRGPSMMRARHLEMIRDASPRPVVIATDGALKECLKVDLIPDYVVTVDGNPICKKWFTEIPPKQAKKLRFRTKAVVNVESSNSAATATSISSRRMLSLTRPWFRRSAPSKCISTFASPSARSEASAGGWYLYDPSHRICSWVRVTPSISGATGTITFGGDFTITTHVYFEPKTNFQFAGLTIYQDDSNTLSFGRAFCDTQNVCVGNGIYFDNIIGGNWTGGNFATSVNTTHEAYLRLERRANVVTASFSYDGENKVDNYYEVIKGLKAGERVVTGANFLIDSESKFKEAVGGMGHAH